MQGKMKIKWTAFLTATMLLTGCANAASEPSSQQDGFCTTQQGPTLVVRDEGKSAGPDLSTAAPNDPANDLVTMNSEEEIGFALFCSLLSESQFRDMLQRDGANFIPDRLARFEDRYFAYYNSGKGDLVVCNSAREWFHNIFSDGMVVEKGRVLDAQWLDDACLLILAGNESQQILYAYYLEDQALSSVYASPEGKVILEFTVDENGTVECELGTPDVPVAQAEESDAMPMDAVDQPVTGGSATTDNEETSTEATETVTVPIPKE